MAPATATSAVRRLTKPNESPRRFAPFKPRRKTFSIATIAILFAVVYILCLPAHDLVKSSISPKTNTSRVQIPLDSFSQNANPVSAPVSALVTDASANSNPTDVHVDNVGHQEIPQVQTEVATPMRGEPGKCLRHILYDKPVKTGSTSIMFAIREFLNQTGRRDIRCDSVGPFSCLERAKTICNGTYDVGDYFSIIGHFKYGSKELVECLRPYYYIVTSIREPYQRRKSAYLWNRTLNGTHFAIPHTAPFAEFMTRLPRCQLYHYYDGKGMKCDVGVPLEERIDDIIDRVDEVIDVYDEAVGPLHKLIGGYVARENESIKLKEVEYVEDFDKDTLKEEQMLYDRLRQKRVQAPDANRLPC